MGRTLEHRSSNVVNLASAEGPAQHRPGIRGASGKRPHLQFDPGRWCEIAQLIADTLAES